MPHVDLDKKREYAAKWRAANREKLRAYQKRHYAKNRETIVSKRKARIKANGGENRSPESMVKRRAFVRKWNSEHKDYKQSYNREYQASHREQIKAVSRKWKSAHKDRVRELGRRSYENNKSKILVKNRAWFEANPGKQREYSKKHRRSPKAVAWRERNRERINAAHRVKNYQYDRKVYRREYCIKNREKLAALSKAWRESEAGRAYWEKTRKKRAAYALAKYHSYRDHYNEWNKDRLPRRAAVMVKWEMCGKLCYICGLHLDKEGIHVDHVHPRSKGGTNDIQNLMPTHRRCNHKKLNHLNYPVARPDLIVATAHVTTVPRKSPRKQRCHA